MALLASAGVLVFAGGAAAVVPTDQVIAPAAAGTSSSTTTTTPATTTTTTAEAAVGAPAEEASLIWDTDLIDTAGLCCYADSDDHYDLPTVYTQTNIRVAGIVVDRGWLSRHPDVAVDPPSQPGHATLDAMETAYSNHIPRYVGIDQPFSADRCDRPPPQTRVLEQLIVSNAPVVYATAGSVRQLAWTLCAYPHVRASIINVIISGGDSDPEAALEWNQGADPAAFDYVMESDLAITWLPAFDGGLWQADRHATLTYGRLGDLLDDIPQPALDQLHAVYQRGDPSKGTIDDMLDGVHRRWIGQFITAINPVNGRIDPEPDVFTFEQISATVEWIVIENRSAFTQWSTRSGQTTGGSLPD